MKDYTATVRQNEKIAENIFMMKLSLHGEPEKIHGGQFVNLSTGDNSLLLRRPFGVCKAEGNEITLCYQIKGEGTLKLSATPAGAQLKVLLPLGNWFDLESYKNVVVVGGGVGIFPLIAAIREYCDRVNFYSFIGFRNKNAVCLLDELEKSKTLTVVTDDGSFGGKGNAVQAYIQRAGEIEADAVIACGPPVMLKALKSEIASHGIKTPCFVSLEERMGCGMGACLVCVCKTADGGNARVCRDGPIFPIEEVQL